MKRFKDYIKKKKEPKKPVYQKFFVGFMKDNPTEKKYQKFFAGLRRIKKDDLKEEDTSSFTRNDHNALVQHYMIGDHSGENPHHTEMIEHVRRYTHNSSHVNHSLYQNEPLNEHYQDHVNMLDSAMKHTTTPHSLTVHSGVGFSPDRLKSEEHETHFHVHLPAYTSTSLDYSISQGFAREDQQSNFRSAEIADSSGGTRTVLLHPHEYEAIRTHDNNREESLSRSNHTEAEHHHQLWKDAWSAVGHSHVKEDGSKNLSPRIKGNVSHIIQIHVPKGSHGIYSSGYSNYPDEKEFILPRNSKLAIEKQPRFHSSGSSYASDHAVWHARLMHDGTKEV